MSTFKGIIAEFPQIRIDYFRQQPGNKPPLACFLSHVHSDHLVGLESMRAPFLYCSAATREILLRLEKHYYRINLARGVLESRNVTYGRSMRKLAKPLPLDTPTIIELAPGNSIRVTLLCANHCVGAVMFLIEDDSKAVLYTGDIRAEAWWVDSLVRNPVISNYTLGIRRLDCIYLDTTFAKDTESYRNFPSKAEGIKELLEQVRKYPKDTIFYFHSWTFGYEEVWVALSNLLHSRIHLDDYRAGIYGSLSNLDKIQLQKIGLNVPMDNKFLRDSGLEIREAPVLCGFRNGNHVQPGCLTTDESVRIHCCERGMGCSVVDRDVHGQVVHIIPIITRAGGVDIAELGAGGGKGDLDLKEELETDATTNMDGLMNLCARSIEDHELLSEISALLQQLYQEDKKLDLDMHLQREGDEMIPLQRLIPILTAQVSRNQTSKNTWNRTIRFPYSRHSSYSELCALVAALKPMDVFPCTVDEAAWTPTAGMRNLFGAYCSHKIFRHDTEMMSLYEARVKLSKRDARESEETQGEAHNTGLTGTKRTWNESATTTNLVAKKFKPTRPMIPLPKADPLAEGVEIEWPLGRSALPVSTTVTAASPIQLEVDPILRAHFQAFHSQPGSSPEGFTTEEAEFTSTFGDVGIDSKSQEGKRRNRKVTNRQLAYHAANGVHLTWEDYGGLASTRSKADREEKEL